MTGIPFDSLPSRVRVRESDATRRDACIATPSHQRLAEHFEARGCPATVCDPRAFRTIDGKLEANGRRIDLVYRRALVAEIVDRQREIEPLLRAYRDGTICMVNPLRSYVTSAKSVLVRLALEADSSPELASAKDLIPRTVLLSTEETRELVAAAPSRWALKKSESHGGMNVVLPGISTETQWREALASSRSEVWIAQEYLQVPTIALPVADDNASWRDKYYNWNPFVFGGSYAGAMVRVSETPLINITLGGGLLPTLVV